MVMSEINQRSYEPSAIRAINPLGFDISTERSAFLAAILAAHPLGPDQAHCAAEACGAAYPCGPRYEAERELYGIGVMRTISSDHPLRIHVDIVAWLRAEIARRCAVEPDADGYDQVQASVPKMRERLMSAEKTLVNEVRRTFPELGAFDISTGGDR